MPTRDRRRLKRVDVALTPMPQEGLQAFLDHSRVTYVAELVASGLSADDAEQRARRQQAEAFPAGRPTIGHVVFDVVVDGTSGGHLWLGPTPGEANDRWWVWDIEIDEQRRGRGVGRVVMVLAEGEARRRGGRELGLNVFAGNVVARGLYESLGYETVSLRMRKPL